MAGLLSKLSGISSKKPVEPREIFMSLPQKDKRYEYPRDVQSEVWKKWFGIRDCKNCIVKMNTGSGKTVVGLMILQSCLNEGKGPATHELYRKIVAIFSDRWKEYNPTSYTNIVEMHDPTKNVLIPFWMWQASTNDIFCTLSEYNNDKEENKKSSFLSLY